MKLSDLDSAQADLAGAAKQAVLDLAPLRQKLQTAEANLASAITEEDRVRAVSGRLHSKIAALAEKAKTAKQIAMQNVVLEINDDTGFRTYRRWQQEHGELVSSLSYAASWLGPDAKTARFRAEISELESRADLLEASAVAQRLAMALAFQNAASDYDPGATIQTSGAWSDTQMDSVRQLRKEAADLKLELHQHEEQTFTEKDLVAGRLFGV